VRFECCLEFLRKAAEVGIQVVVVDGSPIESIREKMRATGAHVFSQKNQGKKGVALREALAEAVEIAGDDDAWLCWQEAEKVDMVQHWSRVVELSGTAQLAVPFRDPDLFKETYPIEQFHSESYANLYLDCAAATFANFNTKLDWHFGPFALKSRHAHFWLKHTGELWDAQVVPIVHAIRAQLPVASVQVLFRAPDSMKQQEEANFTFVEKRLLQINFLDPKVIAALKGE